MAPHFAVYGLLVGFGDGHLMGVLPGMQLGVGLGVGPAKIGRLVGFGVGFLVGFGFGFLVGRTIGVRFLVLTAATMLVPFAGIVVLDVAAVALEARIASDNVATPNNRIMKDILPLLFKWRRTSRSAWRFAPHPGPRSARPGFSAPRPHATFAAWAPMTAA